MVADFYVERGLTGNVRYSVLQRLFRSPLVVLEVEYWHQGAASRDDKPVGYSWRRARPDDVIQQPTRVAKERGAV